MSKLFLVLKKIAVIFVSLHKLPTYIKHMLTVPLNSDPFNFIGILPRYDIYLVSWQQGRYFTGHSLH